VVRWRLIWEQKKTTEMELYLPESNYQRIGTPAIRIPWLSNVEYSDLPQQVLPTNAALQLIYQHTMIRNGWYTISVDREFAALPIQRVTFDAVSLNVWDVVQFYGRETGWNQFGEIRINGLAVITAPTSAGDKVENFRITFDEVFTYTTTT
jgi:hypothetical protein